MCYYYCCRLPLLSINYYHYQSNNDNHEGKSREAVHIRLIAENAFSFEW